MASPSLFPATKDPFFSLPSLHPTLTFSRRRHASSRSAHRLARRSLKLSCSNQSQQPLTLESAQSEAPEGDAAMKLFEKLKAVEKDRIEKLEKFEEKSNMQLERQLLLASAWSRKFLALQGKLKGTELDPVSSHKINYSDFWKLLNARKIQFMEYSDYGQSISVILPYGKDGKLCSLADNNKEVVFRRHIVDKMPIDCWGDVWKKLHEQPINMEVYNVDPVSTEIRSTISVLVIWSMRLALSVAVYFCIDSLMRPIYARVIPCEFRKPTKPERLFLEEEEGELGSLGKSRAKFISAEESTGVTFDDFAGQEYIKRELQEIVRILKKDKEYEGRGIYCPKGVLLHGPPGTGKTLLAKAIAGEAGLPFFAANGTDFVEMFVGVAAARVKNLFATARSNAPSIIFIDEIDAIGSKRGGVDIGGGGAEREQGLLQILTEMDGFKQSTKQILVIGATNRLDILDPALLRKGRFDKIVRVGLPSKSGRLAILKVHAKNKYFKSENEKEAILQEISESTNDFTGAELQNILNEAGILTARKDMDFITRDELFEALQRQRGTFETGQEDSTALPEETKLRLAYREAAVAILSCFCPSPRHSFTETHIRHVRTVSNMRYAKTSGRAFFRKTDYVNSIVRACAPRVIEEEIFGVDNLCWISAKATSEAALHAEYLILRTGMTAFGKVCYRAPKDLVNNLGIKVEALRDEYMRFAMEKCRSILREYRSAVESITDVLLESEEIKADRIWEIFNSAPRMPQPHVHPVDEYGALIYAGRWGFHGISLPGRVTFSPGNIGFSTFGAPRPLETQIIRDETWKMVDEIFDQRVRNINKELVKAATKKEETPQLLMADHIF